MMKTNRLRHHYPKLTPVERVNLVLSAQERGDAQEVWALEQYCSPIQSIQHNIRMLGLARMAALLVVQLLAREVLVVKRFMDLAAQTDATPVPHRALTSFLEQQAAIWHGFAGWCRDLGHDPQQVLRLAPIGSDERDPACFIIRGQIEMLESWTSGAAEDAKAPFPDPDKVQMWRELFTELFQLADPEC